MNTKKILFYGLMVISFFLEGLNKWTQDHKIFFVVLGIIFFIIGASYTKDKNQEVKFQPLKEIGKIFLAIMVLVIISGIFMGGFTGGDR